MILYRFFDADGVLLYIGKTVNPSARFKEHCSVKSWWQEVSHIRLEHQQSLGELNEAERIAIQTEHPKYNRINNSAAISAAKIVSLNSAGKNLADVRAARDEAFKKAKLEAITASEAGVTEVAIARTLGVDRMTIRKWVGKR